MADFITYKGFKIEVWPSGFSVWGKSPFYPIDTMFCNSKSLAKVKRYINDWLKANNLKRWRTTFPDFIAKESLTWPR